MKTVSEVVGEEREKEKKEFNFTICIRVRPMLAAEQKARDERCVTVKDNLICLGRLR